VGSSQRQEQPLLASRLRQAVKKGTQLNVLHIADDELFTALNAKLIVSPAALVNGLAQVLKASVAVKGADTALDLAAANVSAEAQAIADSLCATDNAAIILGNVAQHHPAFAELLALAQELSRVTGARFGITAEAANSVGADIAGANPARGPMGAAVTAGLSAAAMLAAPRKAYFLLNTEVEADTYNGQQAVAAMKQAATVIALTAYKGAGLLDYADVLLPIAPFAETAGSFVNMEGKLQSFNGVVRPQGEARPAWKVLRVLGNMLGLEGFEFNAAEEVRAELLAKGDIAAKLGNAVQGVAANVAAAAAGLVRAGEVPLYHADAICRRADSLQQTAAAATPVVSLNPADAARLGLNDGDNAVVSQGEASVTLQVRADKALAEGVVRVAAAHPATQQLGGMFDPIQIKRG
jgi:NADH-quinone oxidoreductase subunit G